jgi:hypothetical protein
MMLSTAASAVPATRQVEVPMNEMRPDSSRRAMYWTHTKDS